MIKMKYISFDYDKFKMILKKNNKTIQEFADDIDITKTTLYHHKKKNLPSARTLYFITKELNLRMEDLLKIEEV
jgi:DNA-binding XRE family transcriptional regulator